MKFTCQAILAMALILTVTIITVHAAGLVGAHVNLISYLVDQLAGAFGDELHELIFSLVLLV